MNDLKYHLKGLEESIRKEEQYKKDGFAPVDPETPLTHNLSYTPGPKVEMPEPPRPDIAALKKVEDLKVLPRFDNTPQEPEFIPSESGLVRYIVTSATPGNQAELIFHNGLLEELKLSGMTYKQRNNFLKTAPANEALLSGFAKQYKLHVVQADYTITFEMWWDKWGKTFTGKKVNKARCVPLFDKYSKAEQVKSYYSLQPYDKWLKAQGWDRKAVDPERYLRDKMHQNEY